jgi:hypothetical protein
MRPRSQAERGTRQAHQQELRVENQQHVGARNGCSNTVEGITGGEFSREVLQVNEISCRDIEATVDAGNRGLPWRA